MEEVILWFQQKEIAGCSLVEIGEVIENSPREDMSRWVVPLGDKGANPRMQRHDVRLASGAWRTSAVGKLTRHFQKICKRGKNEQK